MFSGFNSLLLNAFNTKKERKKSLHSRYSPLIGKAVNYDGQGKDEHDYPKTDANQLL